MNATNSLFGALPMPGHGSEPTPEATLPSLTPADDWPDDSWAEALWGRVAPLSWGVCFSLKYADYFDSWWC